MKPLSLFLLALGSTLGGCAAAPVARVTITPIMPALETSERWGRCVGGGVHVAGTIEVTSHLCWRWLAVDGGAAPDAGAAGAPDAAP